MGFLQYLGFKPSDVWNKSLGSHPVVILEKDCKSRLQWPVNQQMNKTEKKV